MIGRLLCWLDFHRWRDTGVGNVAFVGASMVAWGNERCDRCGAKRIVPVKGRRGPG